VPEFESGGRFVSFISDPEELLPVLIYLEFNCRMGDATCV
jgi:hypothetical protein